MLLDSHRVVANQMLEGLEMTDDEIERSRAILAGDLSIDDAVAEIHRELQASDRSTAKTAHETVAEGHVVHSASLLANKCGCIRQERAAMAQ